MKSTSISSGLYKYSDLDYKVEHWPKGIRPSFSVSFLFKHKMYFKVLSGPMHRYNMHVVKF